ncbi:predicted protein, partial [Postia placenta Mad-698-R]
MNDFAFIGRTVFDGLRDRREKRYSGKLFIAPTDYMTAPKPDPCLRYLAIRPSPRELKLKSELTRCFEKEWVLDAANKQPERALAILYSSWVGPVSYPNRYKLQLLANSMACRPSSPTVDALHEVLAASSNASFGGSIYLDDEAVELLGDMRIRENYLTWDQRYSTRCTDNLTGACTAYMGGHPVKNIGQSCRLGGPAIDSYSVSERWDSEAFFKLDAQWIARRQRPLARKTLLTLAWSLEASEDESPAPAPSVPAVKKPVKSKWEGEDEEDKGPVSDWEASSDEEEKPKPSAAPVAAPKKKGTLKAKLAEKEALKAAQNDDDSDDDDYDEDAVLDPREKARRDKERELNADLSNAADLLGAAALGGSKPLYAAFLEHHVRELAMPLRDVEVRKTASVLTTLANEKQKEQRDKAS